MVNRKREEKGMQRTKHSRQAALCGQPAAMQTVPLHKLRKQNISIPIIIRFESTKIISVKILLVN